VEILDRESVAHSLAAQVTRTSFATLSDGPPVACDENLRSKLRQGANELGLKQMDLPSGAGHDAAFMSRIAPSAMVFVPCRAGKSHAPEEWADRDALAAGAAVIYQAVKDLDQSLTRNVQQGAA
jgi:N-carbamoyl-L-amino-acid hydrolase